MDKKRTFHHKKEEEDEEPKKATAHPKVEEVEEEETMSAGAKKVEETEDPLDNEDATEETAAPEGDAEVDAEPAQAAEPSPNGPKINFDYPQSQSQQPAYNQIPKPAGGSNLDDLADQPEEEYDQANQPTAQGGPAPRPVNPYAQQQPPPAQEFGIKSIRQPNPGPSFPGGQGAQNMNGNGDGRPSGQFGPGGANGGNFNFRREGNSRSNSSSKVYFLVLLVIGLVVLGGAVYLLKNQLKPGAPKSTPAPEVAITTPEPVPTPAALDRSQFTLRVLNGSGKTGLAAEVADKLKALGYKIEKTGNATNSAFQQTVVRTQNDQKLSDQLIVDLKGLSYDPASSSALKSTDASNGEVILGAK